MYHSSKIYNYLISNKFLILISLIIFNSSLISQSFNLGWTGEEIIPQSSFTDKNNWIPGYQAGTGDTCYVATDDSCVYLHWKFGSGKRYKYVQIFQVINPVISLTNKDIIGIDIKGSSCHRNRNIQMKIENGLIQALHRWENMAGITRWCERISVLKKQFDNADIVNWDSITVISFEVFSAASDDDTEADSGIVAFRYLRADSISSWDRATSFETFEDSSILSEITNQTISALLNRQDQNTGLFYTWINEGKSFLYGQGLLLKILSVEGNWENSVPIDSCAKAAEKLALFLANNQDKSGYWPRAWYTATGEIIVNLEDNGTVWMGDFPWIITGLQNYYNKSGDIRIKRALEKAKFFLYNLIDDNGKFYTINPNTLEKQEVTSSEAYAAAILSVYETGDSATADAMLNYIDSIAWDSTFKYWKEGAYSPRVVLFGNTWLAPFFKDDQKALDALSFVGKVLYTKGPGEPAGLDGIGPVATWYEGSFSYISTGGPGSEALFYDLINYRYPDGTIPHYNDSVTAAGVWAVEWSSLDGTSWLYFAASRKSPFERLTTLREFESEPKKVFIHTMGWYAAGDTGRHWKDGHKNTPLIGTYNSQSRALQLYQVLLSYSCGINGMIMNQKDNYDKKSISKMLSTINWINEIDSINFNYDFAISYDDQGMDIKKPLDTALTKIVHIRDSILPVAHNYLYYYDKPAMFVFNYSDSIEYLTAHEYDSLLGISFGNSKPLLFWNEIDTNAIDYADSFYPWVGPDSKGWNEDGSNWGKNYLAWFYPEMDKYKLQLQFATGGVWPGFDDRPCSWGKDRWMDRKNGIVYDSTWSFIDDYLESLPLKWVIIETWNDWNEGTEIEPSEEFRYKYLLKTIENINSFKETAISLDTCKFEAAGIIYNAANKIEQNLCDSAEYYPYLEKAIKNFINSNCDSAIYMANIVLCSYADYSNEIICEGDSTLWRGKYYSESGTYYDSLSSIYDCDSIYELNLTVNPSYHFIEFDTICRGDSIKRYDESYCIIYSDTLIYDTFITVNGCDSVVISNLTVNPLPAISLGKNTTIFSTESITLNAGEGYKEYCWSDGSDKSSILIESTAGIEDTIMYWVEVTDENGCKNSDTINITIIVGILKFSNDAAVIIFYPNPSDGKVIMSVTNIREQINIDITDVSGQKIYHRIIKQLGTNITETIDISSYPVGIYLVGIYNDKYHEVQKLIVR